MKSYRIDAKNPPPPIRKGRVSKTDDEIERAARKDPDTFLPTEEELKQFRPEPLVRRVRISLGLSQRAFAARYGLSLSRVRDWEQGRSRPSPTALLCLRLIQKHPEEATRIAKEITSSRGP